MLSAPSRAGVCLQHALEARKGSAKLIQGELERELTFHVATEKALAQLKRRRTFLLQWQYYNWSCIDGAAPRR